MSRVVVSIVQLQRQSSTIIMPDAARDNNEAPLLRLRNEDAVPTDARRVFAKEADPLLVNIIEPAEHRVVAAALGKGGARGRPILRAIRREHALMPLGVAAEFRRLRQPGVAQERIDS